MNSCLVRSTDRKRPRLVRARTPSEAASRFLTRIAINFESDIEDFEEALDGWLAQLPDSAARRAALLSSDESTKTLIQGIVWNQSDDNLTFDPAP